MRRLFSAILLAACGTEPLHTDTTADDAAREAARIDAANAACDTQTEAFAHLLLDRDQISSTGGTSGAVVVSARLEWSETVALKLYKREKCVLDRLPQCDIAIIEAVQTAAECVLAVNDPWPVVNDPKLEIAQYGRIDDCYAALDDLPDCCLAAVDPYWTPGESCYPSE